MGGWEKIAKGGKRRTSTSEEIDPILDPETVAEVQRAEAARAAGKSLTKEMDGVLDKIDEVLEDNAEEFVRSYIQKGGE